MFSVDIPNSLSALVITEVLRLGRSGLDVPAWAGSGPATSVPGWLISVSRYPLFQLIFSGPSLGGFKGSL